ncbi:MAG: permease [Candidatus Edwardsbacteria bacterium]|nr:permease [Candidatus Edwardsbacteria bacterium]
MLVFNAIALNPKSPDGASGHRGPRAGRGLVAVSLLCFSLDLLYRLFWGISPQTRDRCLLYASLPRWAGLLYENLVELILLIIASVFLSVLLERHLTQYSRMIPSNPLAAFLCGAMIPVCSCGILPLAARFKDRMGLPAMAALLVTGPLLSPQILLLSLTVAGPAYTAARIAATLALALTSGLVIGRPGTRLSGQAGAPGCSKDCGKHTQAVLSDTWETVKGILPSALMAGSLGVVIAIFNPLERLNAVGILRSPLGVLAATLAGVPVYLCNGADIVFLKPLMAEGLPLGTALAFSVTSSSVCATSLVLMSHLLGKRTTGLFLAHIVTGTILIGILLNRIYP